MTFQATETASYEDMLTQVRGLMVGEKDMIANMANISALLFLYMPEVNWAGFYLYKDDELVLGPFQGKPACIRIPLGRGVCGTAAKTREIQLVADVHQFPGHIACDAASNSEVVIPIVVNEQLIGVLDIDSPVTDRFSQADVDGLVPIVRALEESLA